VDGCAVASRFVEHYTRVTARDTCVRAAESGTALLGLVL
jgi:hypothetical protein